MPKVLNRERLRRKLLALSPEIKKQIQPALERGAQEIADLAIHLVPVDTGALKNSIDWGYGEPPDSAVLTGGRKTSANPQANDDLKISIWAGNDVAYYARWVEFGTRSGTKAQPFFFPAYRTLRKSVKNRIARAVKSAIKKVANGGH